MTEEADIGSHTNNNGNIGGNIKITAADFLRMSDDTHIDAMTRGTNKKAGLVKITAGDIKMYDDATINVGTYTSPGESSGDGGEAIINAHTLTITNKADIFLLDGVCNPVRNVSWCFRKRKLKLCRC
jgi:hypothetical protein